jgi:hypothetical protein
VDAGYVPSGADIRRPGGLIQALRDWRPGRRAAIVALAACPLAGAAIGAAAGPNPSADQEAEALVIVGASNSALTRSPQARAAWTRTAAAIAASAQTAALAKTRIVPPTVRSHPSGGRPVPVHVSSDPQAGVIKLKVRASKPGVAASLANLAALQTATLTRTVVLGSNAGTLLPLGDFEGSIDGWRVLGRFSNPPSEGKITSRFARFGTHSVVFHCPADPPSCGPSVPIYYLFRRRTPYTATLWARSTTPRARATIVFGSAADDVSQSHVERLGPKWRQLVVQWTPKRATGEAELAFQMTSPGAATVELDGAAMVDPPEGAVAQSSVTAPKLGRALARASYVGISPARQITTGAASTPTVLRALAGAAAGLLVALAAIGGARLARRRREGQPDEDPGR